MEDQRFDGLVRACGHGTSRRGALGFLAAAAGLGLREVSAKAKHRQGKHKQQAQGKPSPKCTPNSACAKFCAQTFGANTPAANQCTSAATKCQGPCTVCGPGATQTSHPDSCRVGTPTAACCPVSQPTCCANQACVNTQTDTNNCGTCGTVCTGGKICQGGTCACPSGTPSCTGKCGGASDGCGGTCDRPCGSPFGADCTSNAACASGICACIAQDCIGGGFCADPWSSACTGVGGGRVDVSTPGPDGSSASVCVQDTFNDCPCSGEREVCALNSFCEMLLAV